MHLLVLPRKHIPTIAQVTPRDLLLLLHMRDVGRRLLAPLQSSAVAFPGSEFAKDTTRYVDCPEDRDGVCGQGKQGAKVISASSTSTSSLESVRAQEMPEHCTQGSGNLSRPGVTGGHVIGHQGCVMDAPVKSMGGHVNGQELGEQPILGFHAPPFHSVMMCSCCLLAPPLLRCAPIVSHCSHAVLLRWCVPIASIVCIASNDSVLYLNPTCAKAN
jgi:hypothetical protein